MMNPNRIESTPSRRTLLIALVSSFLMLAATGCASSGGGGAELMPPPPESPLAKVQIGWTDLDVRKAIGEPDNANAYMTGKSFIPFYFGGDTTRTDWFYQGQGRVVFSRNAYSGSLKVVEVRYDPNDTFQ